jgi:hypothetical protein
MPDLIKIEGSGDSSLCRAVDEVFTDGWTKLPHWLLTMAGMSGRRYRIFINNLVSRLGPETRYLEIGTWTGSTTCAALSGNKVARATVCDHWFQYGGKDIFYENLARIDRLAELVIIDGDYRRVDWGTAGRHNVYLYDADHTREGQANALRRVLPALDREFVFIVDDWNWARVREGTALGLKAIGGCALRWIEVRTTPNGHCPPPSRRGPKGDWHNGYLIAVISQDN